MDYFPVRSKTFVMIFIKVVILISLVLPGQAFDNKVLSHCLPQDKICSFELNIEKRRNMAVYGRPKDSHLARDNARLLEISGGQLFIHNNSACGSLKLATETEINQSVTSDGNGGFLYTINGQFPGPTLTVYEGQEVAVKVTNLLNQETLTIHWHGMRQKNTNWMDGVPTVTQCAIAPQQSYMYRFFANPAGTHWYHSHQGAQRTDGLYGAFVVLPAKQPATTLDPHNSIPRDFVVLVQDKFPEDSKVEYHNFYYGISTGKTPCYKPSVQADGTTIGPIEYYSALINGKGYPLSIQVPGLPLERFDVRYGLSYRFRLINPGLLYTFKFSIDNHELKLLATDGTDLIPIHADAVYITPGERYDVMVDAKQPLASYWIRMETLHWNLTTQRPIPQSVKAILDYREPQSPSSVPRQCTKDQPCVHINCPFKEFPASQFISCIHVEDLQSKHHSDISRNADKEIFLNFHYANATDGGIRSAINGIQHLPSSISSSSQPRSFENTCDLKQCADGRPCRCTYQLDLPTNSVIHMVFFTQMWKAGSALIGSSHPVHMHGHHFEVIKVGYPETDPVTKIYKAMSSDIVCNNNACNKASWGIVNSLGIKRANLVNPVKKDTVHVPAGGYVVVRYLTDNPGFWMLHCHIENHNLEGMALIMKEGEYKEMNPPPPHFPQCGSFHLSEEDFRASLGKRNSPVDTKNTVIYILIASVCVLTITTVAVPLIVHKYTKKTLRPSTQHGIRYSSISDDSLSTPDTNLVYEEQNPGRTSQGNPRRAPDNMSVNSGTSYEFVDRPQADENTHLIYKP